MKELTPEQIQENWEKLIQIIKDTFEEGSERREKLLNMYHHFEDRMSIAPASSKEHYHNAMPGGYVEHILNIIECAKEVHKLWEKRGAMINFTDEELIFAAMHHDLGKVGDLNHDYYVPQDSEWHRKNKGEIYEFNKQLQFMRVPDRGLWILQHFGIRVTDNEYIAIRLTDGLYDEGNKAYLLTYNPSFLLRSNLSYILHQADMMTTHIEFDEWQRNDEEYNTKLATNMKKAVESKTETSQPAPNLSKKSQDLFDELFGDKV